MRKNVSEEIELFSLKLINGDQLTCICFCLALAY